MTYQNRNTTRDTYLRIWRQFNNFIINLDYRPQDWESRVTLFIGYKIENGMQSATVKSYVSAIKRILIDDGYQWNDNKILLGSLTRACRIINDRVHTRLPINCCLLELILFEIDRCYNILNQPYLRILYQSIFILCYYGMMRVGEVTQSPHVITANNIHIAQNKDKILIVLYSSKTHGKERRPQKIKITSNRNEKSKSYLHRNFCPFKVLKEYLYYRGDYETDAEQFFIFRDKTVVTPSHARSVLKIMLDRLGLNTLLYGMHSFRVGRCSDLIRYNYSLDEVRRLGRWRSNAVYKYIRD